MLKQENMMDYGSSDPYSGNVRNTCCVVGSLKVLIPHE